MITGALKRVFERAFKRSKPTSAPVPSSPQPATLLDATAQGDVDLHAWIHRIRVNPKLYAHLASYRRDELFAEFPELVERTIQLADEVVLHKFNLLGSGTYVPSDTDRPANQGGYQPIDWYLDPVRGSQFKKMVPYKDWDLFSMRPENADIKLPWELGRCQHWIVLGQAWVLTCEQRYAREIAAQMKDFLEVNPVGMGINWTCTMDVAIRGLNWALAFELIRDADFLGDDFWLDAYSALYEQAAFIINNLENFYEVTSNHFLSNVVGLFYLATVFGDLPTGVEWGDFCRKALEEEIVVQVLPDGADYESSVPYHRLVTELFLGAARLAGHSGAPLSSSFRERLVEMVDFLAGVLRPDGLMPQIGDADDGRLHVFTDFGRWAPQDPRHIFAPASATLSPGRWMKIAGEEGRWEGAWWGFSLDAASTAEYSIPDNYTLYPHAGLAVARGKDHYLLISNGVVGTNGFGNHKHNDLLSFEYHHAGHALIVDPGSFVYTSDFEARNRFRSTAWHNTLCVDGTEQNEFKEEWLFRMFAKAEPEHAAFEVTKDYFQYIGMHDGYMRINNGVKHYRGFKLLRQCGTLIVCDALVGTGEHGLEWNFSCAPGVEVEKTPLGIRLSGIGRGYALRLPEGVEAEVREGAYSPSYGVTQNTRRIVCQQRRNVDGLTKWVFILGLERNVNDERIAMMANELAEALELSL